MPVVLRVNGYKFFFYEADVVNEPPHVHITKDGNEAKFWLNPIQVEREGRFRKTDLRDIERIIRRPIYVGCFWRGTKESRCA